MAKGDKIIVTLDLGDRTEEKTVLADAAGRRVEFAADDRKGIIEAWVYGSTGKAVRSYRFRADRVIAVEERPRTSTDAAREKAAKKGS
jgi:hypothetical protein